jgi:hypothetical protein
MSGSSAPATCKNATPTAREVAAVDANFRSRTFAAYAETFVWAPV